MDKVRLIDANALDTAIDAAQNSLASSDDRQWCREKPYFKGLAWARRLVREAPTIAKLAPAELAGLRAMIYRHEIPAADVVPVRRGRWWDVGSLSCRCSECGCKSGSETRYCPHCGARMDGEREEHETD